MEVRLTGEVPPYSAGTVVDVSPEQQEELLNRKLAVLVPLDEELDEPVGSGFYLNLD